MVYTSFFASILRSSGCLELNDIQLMRVMNIIHIESKIEGLAKAEKFAPEKHDQIDMEKFKCRRKLTELTGNLQPHLLIKEMYMLSELRLKTSTTT